ncbi:diguanylate cyclase (GGDEF) domain-containing protein [Modicisalibacter ilicicola DSM 19980]|uniref:diguanylate cyclase n=1 Tax=Modicisalibacter ilicicola DSM 19980 TaxID=1121942 RepID=A0A1M4Z1B2_9GAMM|nr:GGDEF domain-containing protein [Halomonas ilicicola]SHF11755.1 diguanylate cyclase (GGDEF) domain-containing protein [Halomonas ilicicola DSM 19980]
MINDALRESLASCTQLPSLPTAVLKVIELAQDKSTRLQSIAEPLNHDSALTARLISLANTVFYAHLRPADTLREAVDRLGLEMTVSLALGFSLARSYGNRQRSKGLGLDLHYYWQRSLTSAIAAQELARLLPEDPEGASVFTAALLQDIGMLALDTIEGPSYAEIIGDLRRHDEVGKRERNELGADHTEIGAWLAASWGLSRRCCDWIRHSHDSPVGTSSLSGAECVMLSGRLADIWLAGDGPNTLAQLDTWLGKGVQREALLGRIQERLPMIAELLDVETPERIDPQRLLFAAKQLLLERNLEMQRNLQQVDSELEHLRSHNQQLDRVARFDPLTHLYNRRHLTILFEQHFADAKRDALELSLVFIDLDHFKQINDLYGHHQGDEALKAFAELLLRISDAGTVVGRYGGEEFLAVLPGRELPEALAFADRLCVELRDHPLVASPDVTLYVTASIGIASLKDGDFETSEAMIQTADQRMYLSKREGRNRVTAGRSHL